MTNFFSVTFEGILTIFSTITATIILLICCFFVYLIDAEKHRIQTAMEIEVARVEGVLDNRIENTFALIRSINSQIIKNPQSKNYINSVLEKFRTSPELSNRFSWTIFSWVDNTGKIIVDAEYGILNPPFDLSGRDYIPLTKFEPHKFHLGAPVFGSTSQKWMIPGGVGVVDNHGKYLGALTIGFEIKALSSALHKSIQNHKVGFELVDTNGKSILYSNRHSFGILNADEANDPLVVNLINKAVSNKLDSIFDVNIFGNSHGILVKKFQNFPYFFVLKYDKKTLKHELWQGLVLQLIMIVLLFFITIVLLILIYHKVQKQRQKILHLKNLLEENNQNKVEFPTKEADK